MKSVILIELKLPENVIQQPQYATLTPANGMMPLSNYEDCYEVLGEVNISEELKRDDSFLFRVNEENKYMKILTDETIYTSNNNLNLYLVWDVDSVEKIQEDLKSQAKSHIATQMSQNPVYRVEPINYNKLVSDAVSNFRKHLVDNRININYKSFDRKNKIDTVLNS
jgi:hypothetical protein